MQFMVSNLTGLPPIWVQGSYSDSGVLDFKGGISTGANHYEVQYLCNSNFVFFSFGFPSLLTKSDKLFAETERMHDKVRRSVWRNAIGGDEPGSRSDV